MKNTIKKGDWVKFKRYCRSGAAISSIAQKGTHALVSSTKGVKCSVLFSGDGDECGDFNKSDVEISDIPIALKIGDKISFVPGEEGYTSDSMKGLPWKERTGVIVNINNFHRHVLLVEATDMPKYEMVCAPFDCVIGSWDYLNKRDMVRN